MSDIDDENELLMVTGRKAGKKRRKPTESDDEEPAMGSKRGRQGAMGDDSDDGMTADERKKWEEMNELEREMFLYEREEQLQQARLGKAVLEQTRSKDEQVEVRASSRRPRAQTGTDSAIGKIAAAHAQREAREKKKQQEQEERQEKQQRARSRRKAADDEQEQELPDDEDEAALSEEDEQSDEEDEQSDDVDMSDLVAESGGEEREAGAAAGKAAGARAETYDEGAGYEETEDNATLNEIQSIQLTRAKLEQWHNEPFFEADLPGLVLRIVPNLGPNAQRQGSAPYMLVRVDGVVQRNSYAFPKAPERTRKWLHLDDLTGTVFRHQMNMVSNSLITAAEYAKAKDRALRAGAKFITKGDVQQALERLQHAHSFKYDQALVKEMLQKKRAAGKIIGGYAQTRARLNHELVLAQQEGRSEDEVQRLRDELDRLEQQQRARMDEEEELLAAAVEAEKRNEGHQAVLPRGKQASMGLALVNIRNRDKNAFKTINAAPGSAVAKAAAASVDGGSNTADVFSRRHTQSKVYWATSKNKGAAAAQEAEKQQQQLRRTSSSGAADVETLKGSLKKLDPAELIKVLDLSVDLNSLPRGHQDLAPRRVLGPRWYQTLERRQQEIVAGRNCISLQEWRARCDQQNQVMGA